MAVFSSQELDMVLQDKEEEEKATKRGTIDELLSQEFNRALEDKKEEEEEEEEEGEKAEAETQMSSEKQEPAAKALDKLEVGTTAPSVSGETVHCNKRKGD